MKITENLYSIDKKLLIKTGDTINRKTLGKIVKSSGGIRYVKIKNTSLTKDIKSAFNDNRYKTILSPEDIAKKTLNIIQNISVPQKIISELKFMRKKYPYTFRHILMVTIMGTRIALDENLNNKYGPKKMARACIVHDIGKSRLPRGVLRKSTPLTSEERKLLRDHTLVGFLLLHYYYGKNHNKCDFASYEHHERLDGSGYPRHLKRVNKYSQPIAVVDVFDALISVRPYRKTPYTLRSALDLLLDEARKRKLNRKIVYLLVRYARRDKPLLKGLKVSKKWRDKAPADNVWGKTAKK